ncbi:MAG: UDP-N-acetylmuramoyl-L-alanyl-D-glutamate--2,6-diaminopimelate ligase [Candidatus Omnitrophota bacterium]|nr:MAG: UDP-N-acetylmuramoyl-L-alanyl-D-glutamate--2,6-diaminopimelate ligase [Candidatus Omnitrophota bacterium]
MRLKKLIEDLDYRRLENISDCRIKGISSHSAKVGPGYLFVAIKGEKSDGHRFLKQAVDKGARAVIIQKDLSLGNKVAKILVKDSRASLADVSAAFFAHPAKKLKVLGITGTNGKTSVSYLIEKILRLAGNPCGVIGTINYRLGRKNYPASNTTPSPDMLQSLLRQTLLAKARYAVMEVSSHALSQDRVRKIDFSSAIFTNLSREHLDYHANMKDYFSSKACLFKDLNPNAWAIVNSDDIWGRRLIKNIKSRLLTFGIERPAQIQARDLKLTMKGSSFTVLTPRGEVKIKSPLIGRHNVYNILAAIGAAVAEDIDFSHIAQGVRRLDTVCGRLERIDCGQSFPVFVDYAHTQDGLEKILKALRQISKNRIILVFGCGGDRDKSKRPAMGRVAKELSDFTIVTSDNPRSEDPERIACDILRGLGGKTNNYKVVLDRFKAIREALSLAGEKDTVVIAGKGHESSLVFADKTVPFSDHKAIRKILRCLPSKKY